MGHLVHALGRSTCQKLVSRGNGRIESPATRVAGRLSDEPLLFPEVVKERESEGTRALGFVSSDSMYLGAVRESHQKTD